MVLLPMAANAPEGIPATGRAATGSLPRSGRSSALALGEVEAAAGAAARSERDMLIAELCEVHARMRALEEARERILNHVSHELMTPIAVLGSVLRSVSRWTTGIDPETTSRTLERGLRNLQRLQDIQAVVSDIVRDGASRERPAGTPEAALGLLEQVSQRVSEERATGGGPQAAVGEALDLLRGEVERFCPRNEPSSLGAEAVLRDAVALARAAAIAERRDVEIEMRMPADAQELRVSAPHRLLASGLLGLIRNAIEHTPDEGRVVAELRVERARDGGGEQVEFVIRDTGVGIAASDQRFVLGGFYHTEATSRYASRRPYAFNAGGKGLDLLRLRVAGERYGWHLELRSTRCRFLPADENTCPGRISSCGHCGGREGCFASGSTEVVLALPRG